MSNRHGWTTALMIGAALLGAGLTHEAAAAAYYEGKTITLIVPFAPGGGADTDARMIAQHFGRFIDGSPKLVVQNSPGEIGRAHV